MAKPSQAIQRLRQLWLEDMKRKHPLLTEGQIGELSINGTPANKLTKQIILYITLIGGRAERVRSEGRYLVGQTFTNVLGQKMSTNGSYIPSTSRKGTADVNIVIQGKAISCEIKIGNDRMSEAQKKYKEDTERAGGIYLICKTFEQFYKDINDILLLF